MPRLPPFLPVLAIAAAWIFSCAPLEAGVGHGWSVMSPDHGQTFAYGTEASRVWAERGPDRHLAVLLDFTNDPFVDREHPREYDYFTFAFPGVTIGRDGHTFYFHAPDGRSVPVARKRPDFLGVPEIHLLPNATLVVNQPHGYLSLVLVIEDEP